MQKNLEKKDILPAIEETAEVAEISIEVLEIGETAEVAEISIEALEIGETAEAEEISIEVLEIVARLLLIMTGNVLNVTTQTFHSVQSVTVAVNLVLEEEVVETAEVEEISIEALEIGETAEVEEISIEALEIEIILMMEIGIVQSVIIPILQDVLSVIDVVNLALEEEVVETAEVVEISIEALEIEETVEVEESEENSLTVTIIEKSRKRIISVNQGAKEQVMLTTTHQNLLFHVNLDEIVMIK